VSPLHKSIHAISGPCHITQLEDMLSHPLVVALELVEIIDAYFAIMHGFPLNYTFIIYKKF
jgi:hypothetical protein